MAYIVDGGLMWMLTCQDRPTVVADVVEYPLLQPHQLLNQKKIVVVDPKWNGCAADSGWRLIAPL